jgi:hypothetical protein
MAERGDEPRLKIDAEVYEDEVPAPDPQVSELLREE